MSSLRGSVDPFSIINIVIGVGLIGGYGFRYFQTKASPYIWLLVAVGLSVLASILALISTIDFLVALIIIFVLGLLSILLIQMTMAYMLRMWGRSMREAFPELGSKAVLVANGLLITYPIVAVLCIVFIILAFYVLSSLALLYVAGVLLLLASVVQVVVCGWLYGTCNAPEAQEKKSQMLRLLILSLLSALPYFLNTVILSSAGTIIGSILLWVFFIITLLPNALVGYDVPPESQTMIDMQGAPATLGGDMNTFNGLVQTGTDEYGQPVYQKANAGVDQFGQPIIMGSGMEAHRGLGGQSPVDQNFANQGSGEQSFYTPNLSTAGVPISSTVVSGGMSEPGVEYVYVDEHGVPIQGYVSPQQPVFHTPQGFVQGGM